MFGKVQLQPDPKDQIHNKMLEHVEKKQKKTKIKGKRGCSAIFPGNMLQTRCSVLGRGRPTADVYEL